MALSSVSLRARSKCGRVASVLLAGVLLVVQLAAAPEFLRADDSVTRVVELLERRLALMPEVAAVKFRDAKPVADPARERDVLERAVSDAQALGFDGSAARAFFEVQIRLARAVQETLITRWKSGTAQPPPARDLGTVLRPELDAIGRELLPAVYLASSAWGEMEMGTRRARLATLLRHPGATPEMGDAVADALGALRITAAATRATLRRVGVVRVGTTGDYAPFSDDRGGQLRGLDIELAEGLAKTWGVGVVFVRTSWPTLMEDLARRRFDVAASGISITPERQAVADFSVAYFVDGKTPIARREEAARFASLAQIDQPGVRVIVNPGGTNERFARERLTQATLVLHPDNRTIFEEIIARRADVMITDGIEVRLQARRNPELMGTRAEPFTRAGKAFLLPRGSALTAEVDAWLAPQVSSGHIAARLEAALEATR